MAKANLKAAVTPMVMAAEALIDKGKKQGFLRPNDILATFPDVDLDPDQLLRIFNVFGEMGIEVSDREMPVPHAAPIPIHVVGRRSLPPEQAAALVKAIKEGDHDTRHRLLAAATVEELDKIVYITKGQPWPEI